MCYNRTMLVKKEDKTNKSPIVIAICGYKNSGKTTLIESLLPILTEQGFLTAVIKHHGHKFDPDIPGTDTYRFNHRGAIGTVITDDDCFMLVKNQYKSPEELINYFPEADIILLEGYKEYPFPKIEMRRYEEILDCDRSSVIAIVSDLEIIDTDVTVFKYNELENIASFIASFS